MMVENLTKETFIEKVFDYSKNKEWNFKGERPALIDFYADWCGPCKMVAPIMEDLSKEFDGKVDIYKIDTEKQMELSGMFGIRNIPSILFIPMEGQPMMHAGALPYEGFKDAIEKELLQGNKVEA
jgi:thioredoxin